MPRGRPKGPRVVSLRIQADVAALLDRELATLRALVGPALAITKRDLLAMSIRAFCSSPVDHPLRNDNDKDSLHG